jgi:Uma2 family endonuclease
MDEMISTPPKTIMELYKMLPEGTLAEVIERSIYMSPAPNDRHNAVLVPLLSRIFAWTDIHDLGRVYTAPHTVFLDASVNAVQPDIFFVSKQNYSIIKEDAIHGSPDLIIEILSPGNYNNDRVRKKNLYERFAVQEYWIIDPITRIAECYHLTDGMYVQFYPQREVLTQSC